MKKGGNRYGRNRRWAVQEWCEYPAPQCPLPQDEEEGHVQVVDGDDDCDVVGREMMIARWWDKACKRGWSQRVGTGGRCVPILVHSVPEGGTGGPS